MSVSFQTVIHFEYNFPTSSAKLYQKRKEYTPKNTLRLRRTLKIGLGKI